MEIAISLVTLIPFQHRMCILNLKVVEVIIKSFEWWVFLFYLDKLDICLLHSSFSMCYINFLHLFSSLSLSILMSIQSLPLFILFMNMMGKYANSLLFILLDKSVVVIKPYASHKMHEKLFYV